MVDGRWSMAKAVGHRPLTIDHRQESSLQFEVNQQPYFLNFIPEKGRWFLFKATRSGIEAVPVVNDDPLMPFPDGIEVDSDPDVVN
jgi:hypothetical protein